MENTNLNQCTSIKTGLSDRLDIWIEQFLIDRKSQNLAPGTLYFYQKKLKLFVEYCDSQVLSNITQLTPGFIRQYLLYLEETKHNPGGIHAAYRALKTFLKWWEEEIEPDNWKNPISKVKAPKVPSDPLEPVSLVDIQALVATCKDKGFTSNRDKALLLFLLDTGVRAAECLATNLDDVNQITGVILIKKGKGRKPRNVYLEKKARKALRSYIKYLPADCLPLWIRENGERLQYWGLREIIRRRAKLAGIKQPGIHDFRRAFALNMLRNGIDIITLSRLMGHTSTAVLSRYLKQVDADLQAAHQKHSPVENSNL